MLRGVALVGFLGWHAGAWMPPSPPKRLAALQALKESPSRQHFLKSVIEEDLARARHETVRTRFPPEPNGYLHLGHAKSINLNFGLGREYAGETHMRFDDTNPLKEDLEYVHAILRDVAWLRQDAAQEGEPWTGPVRYSSDYFDAFYAAAEHLIETGHAYVDSLSAEEMREYRGTLTEPGRDSPDRTRPKEESLEMFRDMRAGKVAEGACVLRAKIDMASPNVNMRDPTLYRVRHADHPMTGDAWCIYPMYDFAHCISDALEGITHSICTLEFQDHRPLYDWLLERLLGAGILPQDTLEALPRQYEFSRLNLEYTVLSKRKLIQLVQQEHVDGWDDPRMPTICGIRRRGFSPAALRLFCERIGVSKVDSTIDVAVLEDCARADLDATTRRAFALAQPLKVTLTNWDQPPETIEAPLHPKDAAFGSRSLHFGANLYIDAEDFALEPPKGYNRLRPGGMVRLKFGYVIQCDEVVKDDAGEVVELKCSYVEGTKAGKTPEGMKKVKGIIQWLSADTAVPAELRLYDRLFQTPNPGDASGDFLTDLNRDSLVRRRDALVEPLLAEAPLPGPEEDSERFQFERVGYFCRDAKEEALVFNRIVTLRDTWGSREQASMEAETKSKYEFGGDAKAQRGVPDLDRVEFRVAEIGSVEPHPDADGLYVCSVDCGDPEPRRIVAGLAELYPDAGKLEGQRVVVVTNLKPAKVRGIMSEGMVLVAAGGGGGGGMVLGAPDGAEVGARLGRAGATGLPDELLKSEGQQKVWKRVVVGLGTNAGGELVFEGEPIGCGGNPAVAEGVGEGEVR